jgi:catechol 2,3-dioxygenase-like lactoylglutathione lyase family enzyme
MMRRTGGRPEPSAAPDGMRRPLDAARGPASRPETGGPSVKFICSLITVENVARSRRLYEGILGQKVTADYGENIAFSGFAVHQRDHFRSLIGSRGITVNSNAFELYFEADDLEPLEKAVVDEGFEIIHGIREQPWRQKVFRFYDADRNIVEIGESFEHLVLRLHGEKMPVEKISAITNLSVDQVREMTGRK